MAAAVKFRFDEPGSKVLRRWNEEQRLKRAISARSQAAQRTFAGAAITRLTMSMAQSSRALNADLDNSLVILRSRARALAQNYEYARKYLSLAAMNIVGPKGPQLQVRAAMSNGTQLDKSGNDAVETHWAKWCESCDIRGQVSFARLLHVVVKAVARDGEALVRVVRGKDLSYGVALQLLEVDRLDENLNRRLDNGNIIRMGVELDSALRPVAYWLFTIHPGENFSIGNRNWERVEARDLYHLYTLERAEQVRGYSWLHAIMLRAAHMQGFEEAAVVASRIGASKMGFTKRQGDPTSDDALKRMADAVDADTGALQMNAEPGEFIDLPPGYDFVAFNPDYPHAMYEMFMRSSLRALATGVDADYASMSNDRSSENYSSIRHGKLEANDVWMVGQEWLASQFLRPFFRTDWLPSALIRGEITMPVSGKAIPAERLQKFADASNFQGRRWDWVDPKNDAEAVRLLIEAGLTSRTYVAASQGRDFGDIVLELAAEKKQLEAAGLPSSFGVGASGNQVAGTAPPTETPPAGKGKKDAATPVAVHFNAGAIQVRAGDVVNNLPELNPQFEATIHAHAHAGPTNVVNPVEVKTGDVIVQTPSKIDLSILSMPERVSSSTTERNASGQITGVNQTEKDA